jgi:dTDP-4-amino-4,6-dideoxygalactose transaminase
MPSDIDRLEREIAGYVGRRRCVLTGRGASAIYIALQSLPRRAGKVVLPAILCPSPANVTLYAGFEPLFCDVSPADYNLDPQALRGLLQRHDDVAAIMPAHIYGHPAAIEEIAGIAAERGIPLIEDAAQSLGGEIGGRRMGGFGAMSILSFGHTKIIDAGGGGAVLTDDEALAEALRHHAGRLPAQPANHRDRAEQYRRTYYEWRALAAKDSTQNDRFLEMPAKFRDLYLYRAEGAWIAALGAAFPALDRIVAARRNTCDAFVELLAGDPRLALPERRSGGVPWRFTFLVDGAAQGPVTAALRAQGIDVSNWYPSLHRWYAVGKAQGDDAFPVARRVEARVVNLWVEPPKDAAYAKSVGMALKNALRRAAAHAA